MKRQRTRTLPTLVWWQWDQAIGGHVPRFPPRPAILLEWRVIERPGRPNRWEGLVLWAESKGGLLRWSIHDLAGPYRPASAAESASRYSTDQSTACQPSGMDSRPARRLSAAPRWLPRPRCASPMGRRSQLGDNQ